MPSYEGTVSITKEVGPCGYSPSEAPAVVFTMIFSALTIANFFQTIRTRYWFMLAVVFGVLCETIGSGLRIYGSFHPTVIAPYIAQQVIIVITPVFFAAIHFTLLGKVLSIFGDRYALIKPNLIVPCFVSWDLVSLIIQGLGSGKVAVGEINSDVASVTAGGKIVVGALSFSKGLIVQLLAYLVANIVAIVFFFRVKRDPSQHPDWTHRTKVYLLMTFLSAFFILGRTIFRVIELVPGRICKISETEWTLLAFDSTFVAIAVLILAVYHPSIYLSASNLDGGEVDEENLKGYQMAEPRSPQNTSVDLPTPKSHTLSLSVSH